MTLRWAQLAGHPEDWGTVDDAPQGYVRATAKLVFDRISAPVVVALIPQMTREKLDFKIDSNTPAEPLDATRCQSPKRPGSPQVNARQASVWPRRAHPDIGRR